MVGPAFFIALSSNTNPESICMALFDVAAHGSVAIVNCDLDELE
jgi:hypothetical protein